MLKSVENLILSSKISQSISTINNVKYVLDTKSLHELCSDVSIFSMLSGSLGKLINLLSIISIYNEKRAFKTI